jgi:hypothetical protein
MLNRGRKCTITSRTSRNDFNEFIVDTPCLMTANYNSRLNLLIDFNRNFIFPILQSEPSLYVKIYSNNKKQ